MELATENGNLVETLITYAISEENLYKKLRLTNVILFSLNEKLVKKTGADKYHKKLKDLINDSDFIRKLKLNATIKENPATAIEYLGKDYIGGDDNYNFDGDFEGFITDLKFETEEMLGKIVKEISKPADGISFGGEYRDG